MSSSHDRQVPRGPQVASTDPADMIDRTLTPTHAQPPTPLLHRDSHSSPDERRSSSNPGPAAPAPVSSLSSSIADAPPARSPSPPLFDDETYPDEKDKGKHNSATTDAQQSQHVETGHRRQQQQQQQQHHEIQPALPSDPLSDDEFDPTTDLYDQDIDRRTTGSTSITSTIYAHAMENGRRYQHFKHGRYPIPNDADEQAREDMKHAMMKEVTDGVLFYAPIGDSPQLILDIGTGTGIWAMEVGDEYPGSKVRGIDLSPVQPAWVPPNVDFLIDDCEKEDWLDEDADLVHLRFMTIVLKDVPTVLRRAHRFVFSFFLSFFPDCVSDAAADVDFFSVLSHRSLKPGGWVELQELCAEPLCDDGTMSSTDPVKYMYDLAGEAFSRFGMNVTLPKHLEPLLRDAGFENIQCVVKKVPIGTWARDKTLRLIGYLQKMAVYELMPALAERPFKALGLSEMESQVTLAYARKGLDDTNVHRYFMYYFWFAQKPKHEWT